jgi:hypothetical protein
MSYAVECDCGNIFVTKKTKTQCKCGKRFSVGSQPLSVLSIDKSRIIKELKTTIQKQENTIDELIKKINEYHKTISEIIQKYRKSKSNNNTKSDNL